MIEMTGKKIGRLTVINRVDNAKDGTAMWRCKCICGKETVVSGKNLRNGHIKSCGCLQRENTSAANRKHSMCNDRLYKVWKSMKQRCFDII